MGQGLGQEQGCSGASTAEHAVEPAHDPLLPNHRAHLEGSGISAAVIAARGYRSVTTKAEAKKLGFSESQLHVPAIYIPIHGVTGEVVSGMLRPDEPRVKDDKRIKYEIPKGSRMRLDVPPGARARMGSPDFPLFVVEGAKKADAAVTRDLCCVSLTGVWNWRGTNFEGGKTALPDLELVHLKDRVVYVVFDSDAIEKKPVNMALERLGGLLKLWDAKVRYVYLPSGPGGAKVGLDDYFAAGRTVDDLLGRASTELVRVPTAEPPPPYGATEQGMYVNHDDGGAVRRIPICNFTPTIVADLKRTDGADSTRLLDIEARCNGRTTRFRLPTRGLSVPNWHIEMIGSDAEIHTARGAERHVIAAMQFLSRNVTVRRTIYAHSGWMERDGASLYLHGGGAIGASGDVDGFEVELSPPLAPFILPTPPLGSERTACVRASLRLLDVAPWTVTVPLLGAVYRAAVKTAGLSVALIGPPQVFKTQLAALAQQHYGPGFDSDHLPAAWSSTANSLEALAHEMKDALLVIDDIAPSGSQQDIARLNATVERVGRAQANSSGRSRCRTDGTVRAAKPPRGLSLWTGEAAAQGKSLRARVETVAVRPGDVDVALLTSCQADARAGLYAGSMAAFVCWLASRRAEFLASWQERVARARESFPGLGGNRRVPTNLAELLLGVELLLEFAQDCDAVSSEEHATLRARALDALVAGGREQLGRLNEADPVQRFRTHLASSIASGRAHVASRDGSAPVGSERAWGWRRGSGRGTDSEGLQDERWNPMGARVGWIDDESLYMDLPAAYTVVQQMTQASSQPLPIDVDTLRERMAEAGHITRKEKDGRLDVKVMIEGKRPRVVVLRLDFLFDRVNDGESHDGEVAPTLPLAAGVEELAQADVTYAAGLECRACRRSDWRTSPHGERVCNRCHPPAPGAEDVA